MPGPMSVTNEDWQYGEVPWACADGNPSNKRLKTTERKTALRPMILVLVAALELICKAYVKRRASPRVSAPLS